MRKLQNLLTHLIDHICQLLCSSSLIAYYIFDKKLLVDAVEQICLHREADDYGRR